MGGEQIARATNGFCFPLRLNHEARQVGIVPAIGQLGTDMQSPLF